MQCLKLSLVHDPTNAEALNNLGVLEHRKDNLEQARGHYTSAMRAAPSIHEPHFNISLLAAAKGDNETAFAEADAAVKAYPEHKESQNVMDDLRKLFAQL